MNGGRASGSTMEKINPAKFAQEVRQEAAKVTWPSRKETIVTTGMVFVMVVLAAAFFFVADQALSLGVRLIMGGGA
jgi:preprotein translocase subunit SecE